MIRVRAQITVLALLALSVGGTAVVLVGGLRVSSVARAAALVVAFGAIVAVATVPSLRRALTMRMAFAGSIVLSAIAVVQPPRASGDLWSYAMIGRIVARYHASPYTHVPANYPHDPLLALVAREWRHTPSLYGPAFSALSAALASIAGTATLPTRLGYQLLAAGAVFVALVLLAHKTRDPVVVLLVGLNPVIALQVVNVGRNDALVGLGVLAGVLLASRRRFLAAAAVIALAALVKIVAIAALAALLLWVWRHHGKRAATAAGAAAVALLAVPYALVGGFRTLRPVTNGTRRESGASIWQLSRLDGFEHLIGLRNADRITDLSRVGPAALLLIAALGLLFTLSRLNDPTPELVAIAALTAFLLAGSFVLASYAAWVIPIAAWRHRAGISRAVLGWSALLAVAAQSKHLIPSQPLGFVVWLMTFATVLFAAVSIVALTVAAIRRWRVEPTARVPRPIAADVGV